MHFQHRLLGRQSIFNRIETALNQSCDGNRPDGQFSTDQFLGNMNRQLRQGFKKLGNAIGCILDLLNQLTILCNRRFNLFLKLGCDLLSDLYAFGLMRLFQGGDRILKINDLLRMGDRKICFCSRNRLFNPSKNLVLGNTNNFRNAIGNFGPFGVI